MNLRSLPQWLRSGLVPGVIGALLGFFCLAQNCPAAESAPDKAAFAAAYNYFKGTFFQQAENAFSNYLATATNSTYRADAVLYLARSRFEQSNYVSAIETLQQHLASAGELLPEYQYWMAESLLRKKDFAAAGEAFGNVIKNFPNSPVRLKAAFGQALVCSTLGNWAGVIDVLGNSNGVFQIAAREKPKDTLATDGHFLLAEALFKQGRFAESENVVAQINTEGLAPELKWRRDYALCRLQVVGGRAAQALLSITNVTTLATGNRNWESESIFLQAEIFEKLNQTTNALLLYTNKLVENVPGHIKREALFKTVDLLLKQNLAGEAIKRLTTFIEGQPGDTNLDQVRLTLGELYFRAYFFPTELPLTNSVPSAGATNDFLSEAITQFQRLIQDFPQSALRGKTHLNCGWCCWERGNIAEAKTNFMEAVNRPLNSQQDAAVARFKLADAQYALKEYGSAATNYSLVLEKYGGNESIRTSLFDLALYNLLRASIETGDQATAQRAAGRILEEFPTSLFAERSQLLLGKDFSRKGKYGEARQTFAALTNRFPNTSVLPEARLVIAQTYSQENNWAAAIGLYDQWVTNFPQHPLLPQAEFSRALAYGKSGKETNALSFFSEFISRFPTNALAPLAQNWIADYYFNHEDFVRSEKNYQELYLKFPNCGDLAFEARLMAGRAALARDDTKWARTYFSELARDTNAPGRVAADAYFELGVTALQQFCETTNAAFCSDAIAAFSQLTNSATTNVLAPLATMKIGDAYKMWAELTPAPNIYTNAAQAFESVLAMAQADLSSRSEAEVKLGIIAERQKLPIDQALKHHLKVLYESDPDHPEKCDPFWVKEAAYNAGRICESTGQWDQAIDIYNRVKKAIPSLGAALDKKIAAVLAKKSE